MRRQKTQMKSIMRNLYNDASYSDIDIEIKCGEKLLSTTKCHKCIISCASKLLKDLMDEYPTNKEIVLNVREEKDEQYIVKLLKHSYGHEILLLEYPSNETIKYAKQYLFEKACQDIFKSYINRGILGGDISELFELYSIGWGTNVFAIDKEENKEKLYECLYKAHQYEYEDVHRILPTIPKCVIKHMIETNKEEYKDTIYGFVIDWINSLKEKPNIMEFIKMFDLDDLTPWMRTKLIQQIIETEDHEGMRYILNILGMRQQQHEYKKDKISKQGELTITKGLLYSDIDDLDIYDGHVINDSAGSYLQVLKIVTQRGGLSVWYDSTFTCDNCIRNNVIMTTTLKLIIEIKEAQSQELKFGTSITKRCHRRNNDEVNIDISKFLLDIQDKPIDTEYTIKYKFTLYLNV